MQIMPPFPYEANWFDPKHNIMEGARRLREAEDKCKWQADMTFVVCYNRGIKGGSLVKQPHTDSYYKKVMKAYALQKRPIGSYSATSQQSH